MLKFDLPKYSVVLPSSGKKVMYRPFVVKERASLLMALQTGEAETILNAIGELFKVCTDGVCVLHEMPIIDTEFLFLNIRNKSVGEDLDVLHECECGVENEKRMSMENATVEGVAEIKPLDMGNGSWLKMKYPSFNDSSVLSAKPSEDEVLTIIASCIDTVISGDSVTNASDSTIEELKEFVANLTQIQLNKIEDFFKGLPKVVIKSEYVCTGCSKTNQIKIEGLQNFFG